ncbi:pH regulation protein F [Fusibacter paucivorans]|uniref:PH regulation protein F n=1 Tax=Fusibacter paucivorans TaxID=76009 RepID=A0ABS5PML5_9FIRM|nr:monovalent cation/H+ antiporter complex subunit F [Fusibacter paucivorans]MBS7526102.1 pH regulation protein F [Fusibacter paucivorans]
MFPILLLIILLLVSSLRIIIGPTIWDRMLGLNMVSSKLIMLLVLIASFRQQTFILDVSLTYALLGFIGMIFMSLYIQGKGRF